MNKLTRLTRLVEKSCGENHYLARNVKIILISYVSSRSSVAKAEFGRGKHVNISGT